MLSGLPLLETLECSSNDGASGNVESLRLLKSSLRELTISNCTGISGDFMQLADFPELEKVDLRGAANVRGNVRLINNEIHFPKLQILDLPKVMDRINESSDIVRVLYPLAKRGCMSRIQLSENSVDRYEKDTDRSSRSPNPPFHLEFVNAGSRIGWRWTSLSEFESQSCETHWLDPKPPRGTVGYSSAMKKISKSVDFYKGCCKPPTEEEYRAMCRENNERELQKRKALLERVQSLGKRYTREDE